MIELDIQVSAGDLYDFNLKHAFGKIGNILAEILGIVGVCYGLTSRNYLMVVIGVLLVLYLPVTLYTRSRLAAGMAVFKNNTHYVLDDTGITVSQGENSSSVEWDKVHRVVSTGRSIIIYTGPTNATILPRAQMGDKLQPVIQCISTHVEPKRVKIKY